MTEAALVLAVVAVGWASCVRTSSGSNPLVVAGMDKEITTSCHVANRRCSHCHPVERLLRINVRSPRAWTLYVDKMRAKSSSGIGRVDAERIKRCLIFRSFGRQGLGEAGLAAPEAEVQLP